VKEKREIDRRRIEGVGKNFGKFSKIVGVQRIFCVTVYVYGNWGFYTKFGGESGASQRIFWATVYTG
jgi:hypothetical protein